jgi:hypothetical protein
MYSNPGMFGSQGQSPFQFVQGEPGTIKNVAVGASEMRFLQTQAALDLPGALVTDLVEVEGKLNGTIQNNTGLPLKSSMLVYNGRGMLLPLREGVTNVNFDIKEYSGNNFAALQLSPDEAMTVPDRVAFQERSQFSQFLAELPQWLLSGGGASPPPCLVAWVDAPPMGSIDLGTRAQPHLGATLAVAWLDVHRGDESDTVDLTVALQGANFVGYRGIRGTPYGNGTPTQETFSTELPTNADDWASKALGISEEDAWALDFTLPPWIRASENYVLQIDVITCNASYDGIHNADVINVYAGGQSHQEQAKHSTCTLQINTNSEPTLQLRLSERRNNAIPFANPSVSTNPVGGNLVLTTDTYTIPEWKNWVLPRTSVLELKVQPVLSANFDQSTQNSFTRRGIHAHAFVAARLIKSTALTVGE